MCVCLSAQRKANDPSRFNNRGGNLLKEEKQRTELQKSLPKVSTFKSSYQRLLIYKYTKAWFRPAQLVMGGVLLCLIKMEMMNIRGPEFLLISGLL